jgi:hypothetical protein
MQGPSLVLLWPLPGRWTSDRNNNLDLGARFALRPHDPWAALAALLGTLVVSGLGELDLLWTPVRVSALVMLVGSISLREASYLLVSLPQRLRRSLYDPTSTFFVIAACDFLSLVLCVSSLRGPVGANLEWPSVRDAAMQLFNLPRQIVKLGDLGAMEAVWLFVGLIYYTAIVKSIAQARQATRNADDYLSLAGFSLQLGDARRANHFLNLIPADERDWRSTSIGASLSLLTGDFGRAVELRSRVKKLNDEPPDNDDTIYRLSETSLLLPLSGHRRIAFVKFLAAFRISDAIAFCILDHQALMLGDTDELVRVCGVEFPTAQYPLVASYIAFVEGDFAAARQAIEQIRPAHNIDELLCVTQLALIIDVDPDLDLSETMRRLDCWFDSNLQLVRRLATHLGSSLDQEVAMARLMLVAYLISDMFESEPEMLVHADSLRELAREIADSSEQFEKLCGMQAKVMRTIIDRESPDATHA